MELVQCNEDTEIVDSYLTFLSLEEEVLFLPENSLDLTQTYV